MPSSRRRVEEKGGYLNIGQVEIVRYKANAEAVFRARAGTRRKTRESEVGSRYPFTRFTRILTLVLPGKDPASMLF